MALNFTVNLLSGIPIPDYQDIGDSLPILNKAFDDLDTRVLLISTHSQEFKTLTSMVSTANGGLVYFLTNYVTSIPEDYLVYINGVKQLPYTDYTVNNSLSSIVFAPGVPTGVTIEVIRAIGIIPTIEDPTKLSRTGGALTGDLTGTQCFFNSIQANEGLRSQTGIFGQITVIPTNSIINSPAISVIKPDSSYLNTADIEMSMYGYNGVPSYTATSGGIFFKRANGNYLAPTATLSGRSSYIINSTTSDGIAWKNSSAINFGLEEAIASDIHKSYISFETLSGSDVNGQRREQMRINSSGNVQFTKNILFAEDSESHYIKYGNGNYKGALVLGGTVSNPDSYLINPFYSLSSYNNPIRSEWSYDTIIPYQERKIAYSSEQVTRYFLVSGDQTNPYPVPADACIVGIRAFAYSGEGKFNSYGLRGNASIDLRASGLQSLTNSGGFITFNTMPINSGTSTESPERMRITSEGDVGIGTGVPRLSAGRVVHFSNYSSDTTSYTYDPRGYWWSPSQTNFYIESLYNSAAIRVKSPKSGAIQFCDSSPSETYLGAISFNNELGGMYFSTGGSSTSPYSNKMVITSAGNVGIGTDVPVSELHINGSITIPNEKYLNFSTNSDGHTAIKRNGGVNGMEFFTNSASRMFISDGGNIGIGTTSPTNALHVSGGLTVTNNPSSFSTLFYDQNVKGPSFQMSGLSGAYIDLASTLNGGGAGSQSDFTLRIATNGVSESPSISGCNYINSNGRDLLLMTNDIPRASILTNGNVGLGTTVPNQKLTVIGNISATGTYFSSVGNAANGIFADAVCFVNGAYGSWTAPANCYYARVTLVAGGGGAGTTSTDGGRSYFNYTSDIGDVNPSANQMFAEGGGAETPSIGSSGRGGRAGWNGYVISIVADKANTSADVDAGSGGRGGSAQGGFGGVGGAGGYRGGPANAGPGGGGGSFGRGGNPGTEGGAGGGGSGGVNGKGGNGSNGGSTTTNSGGGGFSGGGMQLSSAAARSSTLQSALAQNPGHGVDSAAYEGGSGGGGWCSAVVSVVPGTSYSYGAGAGGTGDNVNLNGSYGMVVIEW